MRRLLFFQSLLLIVNFSSAQNSQWNLVKPENLNTEIESARIDYGNSIVELTTGVGTYYFDMKSGLFLTKFGRKNWSNMGQGCDSLKLLNFKKYSSDRLISIDSNGKIEANNRTFNFTPINRGLNPMNEDIRKNDVNLDVNCENKWQPSLIKCNLKNPLHLLIKKFWFEIKNRDVHNNLSNFTLESINDCEFKIHSKNFEFITSEHIKDEVMDSINDYYSIISKYKNSRNSEFICFDDLYSDGIVLNSLGRDFSISSLLQFSEEYNSLYFNDGFYLVSPDSSRLLYRPRSYDEAWRGYVPFILFDLKNYEIIQILDGEACFLFGYAVNEISFSAEVISFSSDSKYVLVGNRLFDADDGSEVNEYYDWICKNDLDSIFVKSGQSETSCYNFGAYFTFFSDTSNICLVFGEKLNSFNLNSMTGSTWRSNKEVSYQDSLQLRLNEIDISQYLEFSSQGELDELNAEKIDLFFSNDSLKISWEEGIYSYDILDFYITKLDSNFYSELVEFKSDELKKQLLNPIFFEKYFRNYRKEIKNHFHLYRSGKYFILIVDKYFSFDVFFIDSEKKEIMHSIRIRQDTGTANEAKVNRLDFDISNGSFIFSTGYELYVIQLSNIKKTHYYPPFNLDKIGDEPIPCIDLSYLSNTEITKKGFDYFPLEQVNKAYPFDPLYIDCFEYEEFHRAIQLDIVGIECSKSGNILISYSDNTACLFDSKFQFLKRIKSVDKGWPKSAGFIDEFNLIYYPSGNSIRFFDFNGKYIFDLFNKNEIYLSNGYYSFSKNFIRRNHFVTNNLQVIGFEQLDPVYNRPDIVLDSLGKYFGNNDDGRIDEYRKSWEKRINRLGLDKEKLGKGEIAVPDAEIVEADKIVYENKEGKLIINVKANDPKYTLRLFNVYVNEVQLFGSAGISIAHLKKQVWDTTVSVPLSIGENKIQVSVMNEIGLENFKYPTYVNYTTEKEIIAKTHYIGIGVNEFQIKENNLAYCVKDVNDLANALKDKNTRLKLYTNQKVTRENILSLKQYLKDSTSVNDKVIISCSSHGLLDDSLNFYLATHDVDFQNPKARGLKYEELEDLLDGIPARQKLLLLDACNSGENDETVVMKKVLKQKEKNMDSTQLVAARGVILKAENENKNTFQKMNELFVNVRNNTGSVIISAAGGQESALEAIEVDGKEIENGAFTYSVLECLELNKGKELKVNQLKHYTEKRVEEITKGKQKPTSRQETMEIDWKVN